MLTFLYFTYSGPRKLHTKLHHCCRRCSENKLTMSHNMSVFTSCVYLNEQRLENRCCYDHRTTGWKLEPLFYNCWDGGKIYLQSVLKLDKLFCYFQSNAEWLEPLLTASLTLTKIQIMLLKIVFFIICKNIK